MPRTIAPLVLTLPLALTACQTQAEAPRDAKTAEGEQPVSGIEPIPGTVGSKPAGEGDAPVDIAPIAPEGEHAFSVLDMLEVDRVSSPAPSPDGSAVAYLVRATDMAANKGRTSLWLAGLDGSEPVRLDAHPKGLSQPTWSPDGKWIYFVSSRSGSSQIWRLPMEGARSAGAPQQVTKLPVPVANMLLSPDGSTLAFSAELFPDCADLQCTVDRLAAEEADPATGVVYDRLFVRHWDTWKDHRRSMLLAAEVSSENAAEIGDARILSKGLDADVPSKPFGGAEEIRFTPDGKGLVFAARDAAGGPGEPWSTNFDLFHVPVDGSAAPRVLTSNPAWDTQPRFSPDGKQLAWVAMSRPGFEADRFRLVIQDWTAEGPTGEPRVVTEAWDRSISEFEFAPDGSRVFATAEHLGQKPLFAIALADGAVSERVGVGTLASPTFAGDRLMWVANDLLHPAEIFVGGLDAGGEDKQLTHVNDALMARTKMGKAEQFSFTGAGGDTVYGWLVEPVDRDPEARYPVAFLIHGGPQGSFGNKFHFRWNPQAYAGAGYAVVMIDFHGSTGYGQDFTDAIRKDWGGKPLVDLKAGLAHALANHPWLDGERVCALGASYGGFMINWIAGNWPDGFRCLVNHDGIFDQRMMYYATEELWFPEWEHGGPEFADPAAYARFNPVDHVERWQTPMLVVHGSLDYRVPIEQGLATFTALQRRGVDSRFLHFPDENHWVLSPANSKLWHDEVLAWMDEKLQ